MSIVENRKAFHDYFIEERFEAGLALEGWEVKAIRAGRAHLKEAYVVVKNGEIVLIGAHITPADHRVDARPRRPDAHAQAPAAPRGDQPAGRQGRARRLHADAARPPLQERPHQARDRARQGQEAARQARVDQGARVDPRAAAARAQPDGECAAARARRRAPSIRCRATRPNHVPLSPVGFLARSALIWPRKVAVRHGRLAYTYASSKRAAGASRPRWPPAASPRRHGGGDGAQRAGAARGALRGARARRACSMRSTCASMRARSRSASSTAARRC